MAETCGHSQTVHVIQADSDGYLIKEVSVVQDQFQVEVSQLQEALICLQRQMAWKVELISSCTIFVAVACQSMMDIKPYLAFCVFQLWAAVRLVSVFLNHMGSNITPESN